MALPEITECVEFGGTRAHTWSYICDTWIEEEEFPMPESEWPSPWASYTRSGDRQRMVADFAGQLHVEWYRVVQHWHFGKVEKCAWCKQHRYTEIWDSPETYNRAMNHRRAQQETPPWRD